MNPKDDPRFIDPTIQKLQDTRVRQAMQIGPSKDGMEILELPPPENWKMNVLKVGPGFWFFHSWIDKRWCIDGKGIVGSAGMCKEARAAFEKLKEQYKRVPRDLIYRFEYR